MSLINELIEVRNLVLSHGVWFGNLDRSISFPKSGHEELINFEERSFWFKYRNQLIYRVFKRFATTQAILDIGGGGGFVSKFLQDKGVNTILIEPLEKGAIIANKRGVNHVLCSTFETICFKEKIPNIGCFDVIEHIEQDSLFLKKITEQLHDNGCIFVTVPAHQFLWSQADTHAGHYRRYSRKDLVNLFKENGLEIKYCAYFFSYLLPLIYFLGRKDTNKSSQEHVVTGWKKLIIHVLNGIDRLLIKLFYGYFPGASLILVASKK